MAEGGPKSGSLVGLLLILACAGWIVWAVMGQKKDSAASARCLSAPDEYACGNCCGAYHETSRWWPRGHRGKQCACYVETR